MPCSPAKARLLLKEKKAIVKRRTAFTIQLTIATGEAKPVSYTHLDVYKRQSLHMASRVSSESGANSTSSLNRVIGVRRSWC